MWGAQCRTRSQTPGSHPEPKADAQPLSHPGVPSKVLLRIDPEHTLARILFSKMFNDQRLKAAEMSQVVLRSDIFWYGNKKIWI